MMRLSCASRTGAPTILAFWLLDFFMIDSLAKRTEAYLPRTRAPLRHWPDGPSKEPLGGTTARHFPSENGFWRAPVELWPNIGGSRVTNLTSDASHTRHMKLLSIDVRFEYPVHFTSDVFDAANGTLARA